jgi:hypothetical protein
MLLIGKPQQLAAHTVSLGATPLVLGPLHRLKRLGSESQPSIHITGNAVCIRRPRQAI